MKIDILTLFPEMFEGFINTSIIKRAQSKSAIEIATHDIRAFTLDKNGRVDSDTVGGGAGLIMKCQPLEDCLKSVKKRNSFVILTSPRGRKLDQKLAHELLQHKHLIIVCGHYEGVDERFKEKVDLEVSIGDYILTGGELAAMVISDSVIRLVDGAITHESTVEESFENGLLEYPQYALPRKYKSCEIPDILFSGNHTAIAKWRLKESLRVTLAQRPDLLDKRVLTKEEKQLLEEIKTGNETPKWYLDAISKASKFTTKPKKKK